MKTPRSMQEAYGTRQKLHIEREPADAHTVMLRIAIFNGAAMLLYFIFEVVR